MAKKEKTFVLSDESINTYGFRVLTEGIDTSEFAKNPLMFYNHNTYNLPIGKWDSIEKKDGKLFATGIFDTEDEMGAKVAQKVEQGFLNAVSIGFDVIETSAESPFVLQGQTRPTITKAKLNEVSVVNFPANRNAYRLSNGTRTILLTASSEELSALLPLMNKKPNSNNPTIEELIIELGKMKGIITSENEAHYRNLAKADNTALYALVSQAANPKTSVAELLKQQQQTQPTPINKDNWTFTEWSKKDPNGLLSIKKTDPARYEQLAKQYNK